MFLLFTIHTYLVLNRSIYAHFELHMKENYILHSLYGIFFLFIPDIAYSYSLLISAV